MSSISANVCMLVFAVFGTASASLEWTIASDTPAVEAEFDESTHSIAFNFKKTPGRAHRFAPYATVMTPGTSQDPKYQCDRENSVQLGTGVTEVTGSEQDGLAYFKHEVDVNTAAIAGSPVWSQSGNQATIAFCGRVDLYQNMPDNSDVDVSFLEVPVVITLKLTSTFATVDSIELERTAATVVDKAATVDYELEVCQCDDTAGSDTRCTGTETTGVYQRAMKQNSNLELCVNTKSDDVQIVEIQSLLIRQVAGEGDDESIFAIGGGQPDTPDYSGTVSPLTAYDSSSPSHIHKVTTRLVSKFFPAGVDTPSIAVTGRALLQFTAGGRRQLADITIGRSLQNQDVSAFEMIVQLENGEVSQTANVDVQANEVSGAEAVLGSAAVLVLLQAIAM